MNSNENYMSLEQSMDMMKRMRENGMPINTKEEYMAFVSSGNDYRAVERLRAREAKFLGFRHVVGWFGVLGEG